MASMARRMVILSTMLLGAGAAAGCGGRSANAPSPTAVTSGTTDEVSVGLIEHHRYHHHGGVTLLIALSLDTLGVSPEQQAAVEKIRTDLHARMEPARAAERTLVTTLADGLAAANMDVATVNAAVAQVIAAAATVHDASVEALNELHGVLTPPQRAALVDKVESHWAVWQKANAEEAGPNYPNDGYLATLALTLDLTSDQVHKIRVGLGEEMKSVPKLDPQEITTHLHAFGDAFRSETFDAKSLTTANAVNAHMVGWGAAHMVYFIDTVGPVLTQEQRVAFAERLREHAAHDPSAQSTARGNP